MDDSRQNCGKVRGETGRSGRAPLITPCVSDRGLQREATVGGGWTKGIEADHTAVRRDKMKKTLERRWGKAGYQECIGYRGLGCGTCSLSRCYRLWQASMIWSTDRERERETTETGYNRAVSLIAYFLTSCFSPLWLLIRMQVELILQSVQSCSH